MRRNVTVPIGAAAVEAHPRSMGRRGLWSCLQSRQPWDLDMASRVAPEIDLDVDPVDELPCRKLPQHLRSEVRGDGSLQDIANDMAIAEALAPLLWEKHQADAGVRLVAVAQWLSEFSAAYAEEYKRHRKEWQREWDEGIDDTEDQYDTKLSRRARAEEARTLAEQLVNPECRRIMLGIAVSYVCAGADD
jgi:hypothetical protein